MIAIKKIFKNVDKILGSIVLGLFLSYASVAQAQMPDDPETKQWAYEHIGAYQAWDVVVGSSDVVVAVIDNGVDMLHPDLEQNMWKNEDEAPNNQVDDDKNGYVDDVWGWNFVDNNNDPRPNVDVDVTDYQREKNIPSHGTAVAGLIGAVGNNSLDGVGLNWHVKIMNIKVIDNSGTGGSFLMDKAIRYAVENGAHIINISAVGPSVSMDLDELHLAVNYAYEKGVLIVAAAGNNMQLLQGEGKLYPICIDEGLGYQQVLGVSAINIGHHLARFSNAGSSCIDITAPGVDVSSTARFSPTNGFTQRYVGGWDGTSFAAPLVTGSAALIKSLQPSWGTKEISNALLKTVQHTSGQDEQVYANLFGAGLLQTHNAVNYARERIISSRPIKQFLIWQKTKVGRKEKVKLKIYDLNGLLLSDVSTSTKNMVLGRQSVMGDFDKDGKDEIATIGENGDEAFLTVYDAEKQQKTGFYVVNNLSKGAKPTIVAGDYNNDGQDELFVTAPGQPLVAWSIYPAKRLASWEIGNTKKTVVGLSYE